MKSTFDEFITDDSIQEKLFNQEYNSFLQSEQKAEKELPDQKEGWESFIKAIDMFSPDFMEDGRSE